MRSTSGGGLGWSKICYLQVDMVSFCPKVNISSSMDQRYGIAEPLMSLGKGMC
jgi:hypothetical protein